MGARNKKRTFTTVSSGIDDKSEVEAPDAFRTLLKQRGYSDKAIKEIWKWYDPS